MNITDIDRYRISSTKVQKIYRKYNYKNFTYYKIQSFDTLYKQYINIKSIKNIPYKTIFTYLREISNTLFLHNITIHNILYKNNYTTHFCIDTTQNKLENVCFYKNWFCDIDSTKKTIDITNSIQGSYKVKYEFQKKPIEYPFTVYTVLYDTVHKILIDKTTGIEDLHYKKIRIPVPSNQYKEWIESNSDNCLYYFLLLYYGYTPYNQETNDYIISYFTKNFTKIYMKKENGIENIKKFIVKYVIQGHIISDKHIIYNKSDCIINFITIMREYVDIQYIQKIIKIFTDNTIYGSIVKHSYPFLSYIIQNFKKKYNNTVLQKIPDMNETYKDAFDKIYTITDNIYIYGGTIRDLLLDIKPTDIDITFNSTLEQVESLCALTKWPCAEILPKYKKITFGKDKGITLEGTYCNEVFDVKMEQIDFTVNKIVYDVKNNILIDITGVGIKDLLQKKIRIPVPPSKYKIWALDWKKPLLFFKMIYKGFIPYDEETTKFVVSYIEDNFEKVYMKKNEEGNPKIQHYLVKVLTHGDIIDNKIILGSTKKRLTGYLSIMSKYITPTIMKKIIHLVDSI